MVQRHLLTERQRQVLECCEAGMTAPQIARKYGITRNAVYQVIQRLRHIGALPQGWTPTGSRPRETQPGADVMAQLLSTPPDGTTAEDVQSASALALLQELRRTRDELDVITQRLSGLSPR